MTDLSKLDRLRAEAEFLKGLERQAHSAWEDAQTNVREAEEAVMREVRRLAIQQFRIERNYRAAP